MARLLWDKHSAGCRTKLQTDDTPADGGSAAVSCIIKKGPDQQVLALAGPQHADLAVLGGLTAEVCHARQAGAFLEQLYGTMFVRGHDKCTWSGSQCPCVQVLVTLL